MYVKHNLTVKRGMLSQELGGDHYALEGCISVKIPRCCISGSCVQKNTERNTFMRQIFNKITILLKISRISSTYSEKSCILTDKHPL